MADFLVITENQLERMQVPIPDPTEPTNPKKTEYHYLKVGDKNLVLYFQKYYAYKQKQDNPIIDFNHVDKNDFNQFRMNPTFWGTTNITSTKSSSYSVDSFKKSMKRDPSVFPILKREEYNDQWHRTFINQARAQDISEVLDPKYVPTNADEKELFQEKQKYVYAILDKCVETAKGKAILRKYEDDFDAQMAYTELLQHHLSSTKAKHNATQLMTYFSSARIEDWNGTTENFILHWQDQMR